MANENSSDSTRRGFLKVAGQSLLLAGLASAAENATTQLAPPDAQPPKLPMPKEISKKARWAIVGLSRKRSK